MASLCTCMHAKSEMRCSTEKYLQLYFLIISEFQLAGTPFIHFCIDAEVKRFVITS